MGWLYLLLDNAPECINRLHNELETNLADDLHTPTILKDAFQDAHKLINTYLISPHQFVLSLTEIKKEVKAVLMSLDCSLLVELVAVERGTSEVKATANMERLFLQSTCAVVIFGILTRLSNGIE
ncbi:hypothetical protein KY285_003225 [Solanum tuberosum]|nr:hypothetical protein KY284_003396 [Solanum tuberosum]KAH0732297.1 hypothetical protein KY289_003485 [Solanum tuberosum]KAH0767354.1 hypothetical protein KY285_003225 [Solanum tuberosum]